MVGPDLAVDFSRAPTSARPRPLLASLAWVPGWPILLAVDGQGRLAALNCAAQPVDMHMATINMGSQSFQNDAFQGSHLKCTPHSAWRSGHAAMPRSWWGLMT